MLGLNLTTTLNRNGKMLSKPMHSGLKRSEGTSCRLFGLLLRIILVVSKLEAHLCMLRAMFARAWTQQI